MSFDWLPPLLAEIAEAAGLDAALALAEVRGGSRISIPANAPEGHWIVDAIGVEAAAKLCAHFRTGTASGGVGGAVLELPVGPSGSAASLRRRIDEMLRADVSADRIAAQLRVHRTTVFRRKAAMSPTDDPRQPNLFD